MRENVSGQIIGQINLVLISIITSISDKVGLATEGIIIRSERPDQEVKKKINSSDRSTCINFLHDWLNQMRGELSNAYYCRGFLTLDIGFNESKINFIFGGNEMVECTKTVCEKKETKAGELVTQFENIFKGLALKGGALEINAKIHVAFEGFAIDLNITYPPLNVTTGK
jgi:hypothetical protein